MQDARQEVAKALVALQEAIIECDLARFFEHVNTLERLAGKEYVANVLLTYAGELPRSNAIVKSFLFPVIEQLAGGED